MNSSYVSTKANWMIWCMENEDGFMMVGSRKVNQLDLEAHAEFGNLDIFEYSASHCLPLLKSYDLTGSLAGFTMVMGKTEFEAFITLMHAFQEEERKEKEEKEAYAVRIKEEKKRKKAHLKAKRQAREGKFDHSKCPETCYYCLEENEPYGIDSDYPEWHDCGEGYITS